MSSAPNVGDIVFFYSSSDVRQKPLMAFVTESNGMSPRLAVLEPGAVLFSRVDQWTPHVSAPEPADKSRTGAWQWPGSDVAADHLENSQAAPASQGAPPEPSTAVAEQQSANEPTTVETQEDEPQEAAPAPAAAESGEAESGENDEQSGFTPVGR